MSADAPGIFVIGDIHGCLTALDTLFDALPFQPNDTIVFLGDYVDRGPHSSGVLERLLELRHQFRTVILRGNHEIMMLQAREDREAFRFWHRFGGQQTLESYDPPNLSAVPREHWQLLLATRPFFETEHHFFVHANAHPALRLRDQPDQTLYWERLGSPLPHYSGKIMVCGHTQQESGLPLDLGHAICIDTFAYGGGWLTCLEVTSRTYWQANELGETRTATLGPVPPQ